MPANLPALIVVVSSIELVCPGSRMTTFWDLYCGNLEVVLGLSRSVRPKEESVRSVRFLGVSNGRRRVKVVNF